MNAIVSEPYLYAAKNKAARACFKNKREINYKFKYAIISNFVIYTITNAIRKITGMPFHIIFMSAELILICRMIEISR